jgi:hypothetical protein
VGLFGLAILFIFSIIYLLLWIILGRRDYRPYSGGEWRHPMLGNPLRGRETEKEWQAKRRDMWKMPWGQLLDKAHTPVKSPDNRYNSSQE